MELRRYHSNDCDQIVQLFYQTVHTVNAYLDRLFAKPFFDKRGYKTMKQQQVQRDQEYLTNFVMEKLIDSH